MDTSELLRRAWEAVEKSGVPESLHEAAFREAVEDLRANEGGASPSASESQQGNGRSERGGTRSRRRSSSGPRDGAPTETADTVSSVDEETFFKNLAQESGVTEADLRDVLNLSGGKVLVTQPQRNLGASTAAQARTIIALVAGARAFGLGESPIDANAVRDEVKRKRSYSEANYASKHLAELEGFNPGGSRGQMVTTSRWVGEFVEAVNQALGRTGDES